MAAFDKLYHRLSGLELFALNGQQFRQQALTLEALLPPEDPYRKAQVDSLRCLDEDWLQRKDSEQRLKEDRRLAQQRGDQSLDAILMTCQASLVFFQGRPGASIEIFEKAIAAAERSGDPYTIALVRYTRGSGLSFMGHQADALIDFKLARDSLGDKAPRQFLSDLATSDAATYRRIGDFKHAASSLDQAERLATNPDIGQRMALVSERGFLAQDSGHASEAIPYFRKAVEYAETTGVPTEIARAKIMLAGALQAADQPQEALLWLDRAQPQISAGDRALATTLRGGSLLSLGRPHEALKVLEDAQQLMGSDDNPRFRLMLLKTLSKAEEAVGNSTGALKHLHEQIELSRQIDQRMLVQQQRLELLEREMQTQRTQNLVLRGERDQRDQQLQVMQRTRRWQAAATILGVCLLAALLAMYRQQQRRVQQLRVLANVDTLTGLPNRGAIMARAKEALLIARHSGNPMSLLILDVDHFKNVNDTYGHPVGDLVLTQVGESCQHVVRATDALGRVGGEEFLIVCINTGKEQAAATAERLRLHLHTLRFAEAPDLRLTASIGATPINPAIDSLEDAIARADRALYRAKANGRDRVEWDD